MDQEHREILELVIRLQENLRAGQAQGELITQFAAIIESKRRHFASEEALLKQHGYPGLAKQRGDHAELIRLITSELALVKGGQRELTVEWVDRAIRPLIDHILGADQAYAEFLAGMGV